MQREIGAISYAAELVRADIKPEAHCLSMVMFSPDVDSCRPLCDSVWAYLHTFPHRGPTYGGRNKAGELKSGICAHEVKRELDMNEGSEQWGDYLQSGDADFAQPPTRSIAAGVHMWAGAAVSATRKLITTAMISTTDAEVHAASGNIMLGTWIQDYLEAIGYPQTRATIVFADNMPTVQLGNGSSPTRSRHIARRIAYCADKVRDERFIFKHVKDENNPADYLTKWVPPKKFRASINYIFNLENALKK